ncbi:hypothetical protein EXIGLDRAFT_691449 [Exidia glandulosa HHB12029]|nr:hypothetical protein EXIGLDRAFT_691449 [Exidia glandulosa HHB12029]
MDIFIKPMNGYHGEEPLALLHVDAQILYGASVVNKMKALIIPRTDWQLKYTISKSTFGFERLQQFYAGALTRQELGFPTAPGLSETEMQEVYRAYTVTGRPSTVPKDPELPIMKFYKANTKIKTLRHLASRGHRRIALAEKREAGRQRVVWVPKQADLYQDIEETRAERVAPAVLKVLQRHDPRTLRSRRMSLPDLLRLQRKAQSLTARMEKKRHVDAAL